VVSVDQATKDRYAYDPSFIEAHDGRYRRPDGVGMALARALVGTMSVVLRRILADDSPRVTWPDDQDPAGRFAARCPGRRSQIAFARGAHGGVLMISMASVLFRAALHAAVCGVSAVVGEKRQRIPASTAPPASGCPCPRSRRTAGGAGHRLTWLGNRTGRGHHGSRATPVVIVRHRENPGRPGQRVWPGRARAGLGVRLSRSRS
jgi:hypothetical protein